MGSPLSPIVANLVLQKLEHITINILSIKPKFYYRYVDDIILSTPLACLNELVDRFNFHPRLSFTMEVGGGELSFLDLTLIINDGRLISN